MKHISRALAFILALLPVSALAQSAPATMPYHTLWGRLGAAVGDTGPAQAIPFSTLGQLLQAGAAVDLRNYAVAPKTSSTVCNGTGDDTATIQSAVNAVNSNVGGTIVFPAGACIVSSPGIDFTNKGNMVLQGQGAGRNLVAGVTSVTYSSATGSLFKMDGALGVVVERMALQYSNAGYGGDLIDLRQVSGSLNTNLISFRDCFMYGSSGTAASLVRLGGSGTLSTRIERCFLQGAVQNIKGGTNANNVYIANNFFNQGSSTSHIGVQGEGWTLLNNTFEPSTGTVANNVTANGATSGLAIIANTFNDGATGTPISLTGAVVSGLTVQGNDIQGGAFSVNAGSAVGVDIRGNYLAANNTCNVIVNSATIVSIGGNQNVGGGQSLCFLPTGPYLVDDTTGGYYASNMALANTTLHGVVMGGGATAPISSTAEMSNGQLLVGQTGAYPLPKTISGDVTVAASGAITIANNAVTLAKLATQATNTVLGNATSGTAVPTALSVASCSTSGSALNWTTNTGFGCNSAIAASTVTTNANLTGPVTSVGNATTIGANQVTRANEAQGVARSVIGVTGNATANVADIQGTANQALVVNSAGTALAFGQVNLSSSAAVVNALAVANGGTNCSVASGTCLDNIGGFGTAGIFVRTGAGAYAARTLGAGAGISITNPDGVAGAPSIAVSSLSTNTPFTVSTGSGASIAANVTNYAGFGAICGSGSEAVCQIPVAQAGTFKNLYVQSGASVSPGTWTVTVRKNLAATTVTCVVSASTCNDLTHTFSVVAGDTVDVQVVSSATATANFGNFGLTLVTTSP